MVDKTIDELAEEADTIIPKRGVGAFPLSAHFATHLFENGVSNAGYQKNDIFKAVINHNSFSSQEEFITMANTILNNFPPYVSQIEKQVIVDGYLNNPKN